MKSISITIALTLILSHAIPAQVFNCQPDSTKREQIVEFDQANSYTCYMEMKRTWNNIKLGTGFLIHPRVVLTAGHNLAYYPASKKFPFIHSNVRKVELYFGSINESNYQKNIQLKLKKGENKFHKSWYWISGGIQRDYAVIILPDSSVFKQLGGHFDIKPLDSLISTVDTINITGSPGDKSKFEIWNESTNNFTVNDSHMKYDLYTEVRNSGSPIWFRNNSAYQIAGVHSRKYGSCNAAVFINTETFNQITDWCKKSGIEIGNP